MMMIFHKYKTELIIGVFRTMFNICDIYDIYGNKIKHILLEIRHF